MTKFHRLPLQKQQQQQQCLLQCSDAYYSSAAFFMLQSHVKVSFEMPEYTSDLTAVGVVRMLEAIRAAGLSKETKL